MSTIMRVLGIMVVGLALHTVVRAGCITFAPSKKMPQRAERRDQTEGRHGFTSKNVQNSSTCDRDR